jgi:hypothetical protein
LRLGSAKEITTYISYKSPEGYYDSLAINVTPKSGGGALKNEDLTRDDLGVLCKFTKTGTYLVKAGDKEAPIVVVE